LTDLVVQQQMANMTTMHQWMQGLSTSLGGNLPALPPLALMPPMQPVMFHTAPATPQVSQYVHFKH